MCTANSVEANLARRRRESFSPGSDTPDNSNAERTKKAGGLHKFMLRDPTK